MRARFFRVREGVRKDHASGLSMMSRIHLVRKTNVWTNAKDDNLKF